VSLLAKEERRCFPRTVSKGIVQQGDAKVFGWKGASGETKDFRDMALNRDRGIEEENMGFVFVKV
jgi:hypothetical protein